MTVTALDAAAKGKLAGRMVTVASDLACRLRDEDAASIGEVLDPLTRQELYGLVVAALAMVPLDAPVGDLLAWSDDLGPDAPQPGQQPGDGLPPRLADYADLRSWDVPREEAAERMGVKVETTYDYDYRIQRRRKEAAA